jgi:undecaprenyl diphosphate synthase
MRIVEEPELPLVRAGVMPRHVGCIMDGNGRWALARNQSRSEGHRAAEAAVTSTVDAALELGIEWLTVYAFSTENWKRPIDEVQFLMRFEEWLFRRPVRDRMIADGVRFRFVGRTGPRYEGPVDKALVPADTMGYIVETEALSAANSRLNLCIAFNYGGRSEIIDAVNQLIAAGNPVTEDSFARALYCPDMPDMDLIVRTSAEERLSNFFPWHGAYAELVFTETLWPDFRGWHLYSAVAEYQRRRRRKGATAS